MQRTVILAGSLREANAYCREKHIRATFASNSTQVKQATVIIELPGFGLRRDRFTLANTRDARLKYGKNVEYIDEADWEMPKPAVTVADVEHELEEGFAEITPVGQLDLTDEETLVELKAALNEVGLTLKKLPQKNVPVEAPVVDTPEGF
jgi:hypothetical protein